MQPGLSGRLPPAHAAFVYNGYESADHQVPFSLYEVSYIDQTAQGDGCIPNSTPKGTGVLVEGSTAKDLLLPDDTTEKPRLNTAETAGISCDSRSQSHCRQKIAGRRDSRFP